MEQNPNKVLCDLMIFFGGSGWIIDFTWRVFDAKYPDLPQMTSNKFLRIKNNFSEHGNTNIFGTESNEWKWSQPNKCVSRKHPQFLIMTASSYISLLQIPIQQILSETHIY